MNHSQLQKKVTEALRKELPRLWELNVHGGKYQRKGIPDHIFMWEKVGFAIEFKIDDDELSPIQKLEMETMVDSGWIYFELKYTRKEKLFGLHFKGERLCVNNLFKELISTLINYLKLAAYSNRKEDSKNILENLANWLELVEQVNFLRWLCKDKSVVDNLPMEQIPGETIEG